MLLMLEMKRFYLKIILKNADIFVGKNKFLSAKYASDVN